MTRPLPYPGFTWSLTQHAVGFDAKTLYALLKCGSAFEGLIAREHGQQITRLMVLEGILTENQRNGRADAWRDYQQILSELGLMFSTLTSQKILITEAGKMLLSGEIGFSELVGAQALRYQYPNGQKFVIQDGLREKLTESGAAPIPQTLTELQANARVLLKPAVLMLRLLIELHKNGQNPILTTSECQAFVLPCKQNLEWPTAFAEIISWRDSKYNIDQINRHARRNIQDWFKFLEKTDFFTNVKPNDLTLSAYATQNLKSVEKLCAEQELLESFWVPIAFDRAERLNWFDWFGHISYSAQRVLRTTGVDEKYVEQNYIAGTEEDDFDPRFISSDSKLPSLSPVDFNRLAHDPGFSFKVDKDIDALADKLREGALKRHAKTLLHDRIVRDLAERFQSQGANVQEDQDSIDLLASWPDDTQAMFEVKTVTRRNLQVRLRTAVGQIQEYAYRLSSTTKKPVDRVVVINTELSPSAWQVDFFTSHLEIGLICKPTITYNAYAPTKSQTQKYWHLPP